MARYGDSYRPPATGVVSRVGLIQELLALDKRVENYAQAGTEWRQALLERLVALEARIERLEHSVYGESAAAAKDPG